MRFFLHWHPTGKPTVCWKYHGCVPGKGPGPLLLPIFFGGGGGVSTKMAFLERGKNTVSSNREGRECQLFKKCWKTPDAKHLESLEPTVTYKPSCWREATRPVAIWVVELLLQFGQKWSSGGPAIPKELPFGGCSQHSWTGYLLMVSHYTVAYSFHYTVAYSFHLLYFRYRPITA